jgi:hypothetical protein
MRNSLDLQRAVAAALAADPALSARGLQVFDGPPVNARPPYVSIGADTVVARQWQGGSGEEHRFSVSLWDSRDGLAAAKAVLAEIERAIMALPSAVSGLRLIGLRLVRGTVRRTQRGWTQGQLEFRVLSVRES